jgi:hypothetical protein
MSNIPSVIKNLKLRITQLEGYNAGLADESCEQQAKIAELDKENRLLKRVEQIFNNSPDLTFDCCKRMLKDDFKAHNLEQQNKIIDILYKAGKCDADCLEYFKALKEGKQ